MVEGEMQQILRIGRFIQRLPLFPSEIAIFPIGIIL